MVSAVIFDCDGVLVDSEILAHEVEIEVLQSIGLHYDRHEFTQRFMGMSDAAFFAALDEDGKARLGRSIAADIREPIRERMQRAVAERLTEVPGAARAVKAVSRARAVASSSTFDHLRNKLNKTGLWQSFPRTSIRPNMSGTPNRRLTSFCTPPQCSVWHRKNVSSSRIA